MIFFAYSPSVIVNVSENGILKRNLQQGKALPMFETTPRSARARFATDTTATKMNNHKPF